MNNSLNFIDIVEDHFLLEKETIEVHINLGLIEEIAGDIFLFFDPNVSLIDRIVEFYQDGPNYFPFRLKSGEITLVRKNSIAYFRFPDQKFRTDKHSATQEIILRIAGQISFMNNQPLKGTLIYEKKDMYNRLSDCLNRTIALIHVETENDTYLVAHNYIYQVMQT
jgi:hypothetical protein